MIKKTIYRSISKLAGNDSRNEYLEIKSIKNKESLLDIQEKYLKKLILHSFDNVPYYHKIFKKIKIMDGRTVDLSKFEQIPILTKEIIRKNHKELISKDYQKRKWSVNFSGGSTGEPVKHIQDDNYVKWANATKFYYYNDILKFDEFKVKKIIFWGSERDLFENNKEFKTTFLNWLSTSIFLNSFKMTEKDMAKYSEIINTHKPYLIRGYTGSLLTMARFIEKNHISIYTPKMIISAAETLTDKVRQEIEEAFGTKVYNTYGSREVGSLAGECKKGSMHIFGFNNYVELLKFNRNDISEDQERRIIVTNLHNYSMPLIRYEIGDTAIPRDESCACKNPLTTINQITGRITEHFILRDGTIIPAEFFIHLIGVACNKEIIKKFQVIQEDYEKIRIRIVLEKELKDPEKQEIEHKIQVVMTQQCKIIWDIVDDIPSTKSGKYLYTKSLLWRHI